VARHPPGLARAGGLICHNLGGCRHANPSGARPRTRA
jgi:hypothetical protein